MNPNTEKILYGVVGLAVGVIGTYFVMDYMQDKEIDDLYKQIEELEFNAIRSPYTAEKRTDVVLVDGKNGKDEDHIPSFVPQPSRVNSLHKIVGNKTESGGAGDSKKPRFDAHEEDEVIYVAPIDPEDEEVEEDALDPDGDSPTEEDVKAAFDDIFIIEPRELGDRARITAKYNHDDGSVEIQKSQSDKLGLEDIEGDVIDNDTLYPLIGEKAYELLADSKPNGKGVVCVRNNVLNVDFVITF